MIYQGRTALVTGASAGLGLAYAEALATRGADLVLTARRKERLDEVAGRLEARGRRVQVVPADLSRPEAPAELLARLEAPIDILVNNAGFGLPGTYARTSWDQQRDFLQLMLTSCAELAHAANLSMHERGWGRIVNVASLAGIMPGSAGHTLYGAVKAFLISASQSLDAEGEGAGVRAQACCPGFTYTEFHDVNGTRAEASSMPGFMWMDAGPVVEGSLAALEGGPVVYVPGKVNKALARTARVMGPDRAARLMKERSRKFRRVDAGPV